MPFCTNPDCPHREKTGSSAEYRDGITHCPECGSTLTNNPVQLPGKVKKTDIDLAQKILITIGLLLFIRLLYLIPLPGVDISGLSGNIITRYFGSSNISVCALGILPYISAYFFVELFSLVIPALKRWRGEKQEGRRKLTVAARWLTLILSVVQGIGISISLARMFQPDGSPVLSSMGLGLRLVIIITLVACVFINLWISDIITSKGIGNGISMLIFTDVAIYIFSALISRFSTTFGYGNFMEDTVGVMLILFAAGALIVFMERGERNIKVKLKNNNFLDLPFKYNTSGIIPATLAASFVIIPATVMNFTSDYPGIFEYFRDGSWGYNITYSIFTVALYFFFASLYYNPEKIISFLRSKNAEPVLPEGISFEKLLDKKLTVITLWGALYLIVYSVLLEPRNKAYIVISGLALIRAVSITLDIINEVKARKKYGSFVKINEMQKPYEAKFLKNLLEQNDIPCFLEGYHHRSLYYFFGPFIGISLYVESGKESEALEIISDRYYTKQDSVVSRNA